LPTAPDKLEKHIEALFDAKPARYSSIDHQFFRNFKNELNAGRIRSAEPDASRISGWRTNEWVKKGILVGFRMGVVVDMSLDSTKQPFFDKDSYPVRQFTDADGVRIVPGGSSIRDGCYIARDVVCMPPMFVNAGAYVDEGTMIDSHALVGSCAQIGKNCHISGGAGIGGVLEPLQAGPVIIEDNCFVGARSEVAEGVILRTGAVLSMGVFLGASTRIVDRATGAITQGEVPAFSVVVPGTLPGQSGGPGLYCAVIVKRVDERTRSKTSINELLRD
jgi:2,3,4,5-tetrahydropyridine-2,6-dicarboxylate N-succinyltransferase